MRLITLETLLSTLSPDIVNFLSALAFHQITKPWSLSSTIGDNDIQSVLKIVASHHGGKNAELLDRTFDTQLLHKNAKKPRDARQTYYFVDKDVQDYFAALSLAQGLQSISPHEQTN